MSLNNLYLYFDGACNNNSKLKEMGIGVFASIHKNRCEPLCSAKNMGTNGTSNIAEWMALLEALDIAVAYTLSNIDLDIKIRIYGDSKLIVNQYLGVYQIKAPHLREYRKKAIVYRRILGNSLQSVSWIPREQNTQADKLSKQGLKKPFFED